MRRPERIVGIGVSVDSYRKRAAWGVRRPASAFTCGVGIDIDFSAVGVVFRPAPDLRCRFLDREICRNREGGRMTPRALHPG